MKPFVASLFTFSITVVTVLVSFVGKPVQAASICINPQNQSERTVCGSPALKIIDALVAKSYFDKRAMLSPMEQQEIERDQKLWRSYLENCKIDENCLRDAFNQRLIEIKDFDKVVEVKKEDDSEGTEEDDTEEDVEEVDEEDADEEDVKKGSDKKNKANGKKKNKTKSKKETESEDTSEEETEEAEGVEEEGEEDSAKSKAKNDNPSFVERFNNWLFPNKEQAKDNAAPEEDVMPKKASPKDDKKSSAIQPLPQESSNYVVLQSDMEQSGNAVTSKQGDELSDFESDKGSDMVQPEKSASGSEDVTGADVAEALPDEESTNPLIVKKVTDRGVEQGDEAEEPSLMSRIFSFFSFGGDDNETKVAEEKTPDLAPIDNPSEQMVEGDPSETLSDLANDIDDENAKVEAEAKKLDNNQVATLKEEAADKSPKNENSTQQAVVSPKAKTAKNDVAAKRQATKQQNVKQDVAKSTEKSAETQKTVQKPFVPNDNPAEQVPVKTAPSIFKRVADFFSSSLDGAKESDMAVVKPTLSEKTVSEAKVPEKSTPAAETQTAKTQVKPNVSDVERAPQSDDTAAKSNKDNKTVQRKTIEKKEVKPALDVASSKARGAVLSNPSEQKIISKSKFVSNVPSKEQAAANNKGAVSAQAEPEKQEPKSFFGKIASFFSSKPRKSFEGETKPNLEAIPSVKSAEAPSDLAQMPVTDDQNSAASQDGFENDSNNSGQLGRDQNPDNEVYNEDDVIVKNQRDDGTASSVKRVRKPVVKAKTKMRARRKKARRRKMARSLSGRKSRLKKYVKRRRIKSRSVKRGKVHKIYSAKRKRAVSRRQAVYAKRVRSVSRSRKVMVSKAATSAKVSRHGQAKQYFAPKQQRARSHVKSVNSKSRAGYYKRPAKRVVNLARRQNEAYGTRQPVRLRRQVKKRSVIRASGQQGERGCNSCVRCSSCKPRFRLKHHLREYY